MMLMACHALHNQQQVSLRLSSFQCHQSFVEETKN